MGAVKKFFNEMLEEIFVNMTNRLCVQLRLFCIAAAGISIIMTALNLLKTEYGLGLETGAGAVVCIAVYLYAKKTRSYLPGSFCISVIILILFTLYVVGGFVEGFAALWFCLYPFICYFILEMKLAAMFSGAGLAVLIALLWTPLKQVLPPVYTQNFQLRFPFLYIGCFVFALALNGFYVYTYMRLQQLKGKYEYLSNQDGLTKLSNRTYLEQYKQKLLEKGKTAIHVLMMDVDYFKQYNDAYGHMAGDQVLKSIANVITETMDLKTSIAVRYGGEEFLMILQNMETDELNGYANVLREKIHSLRIPHNAGDGYVSISIGVSSGSPGGEEEFMNLLKQADEALYRAKLDGRNRVCIWEPGGA